MEFNNLGIKDVNALWEINEEGLPGTGKISPDAMSELLQLGEFCIGAYEKENLLGFVICLLPNRNYGSLNYAWFNDNYTNFLYVDRIAVSERYRNQKIGSLLYEKVINHAQKLDLPIAAEVSLKPPNPDSIRFHKRHGFVEVGVLHHEKKSVTMMLRDS
tara:strand:- start:6 stop:482 length:477 start_codon:yes stop_codon:yes gene_type:complete